VDLEKEVYYELRRAVKALDKVLFLIYKNIGVKNDETRDVLKKIAKDMIETRARLQCREMGLPTPEEELRSAYKQLRDCLIYVSDQLETINTLLKEGAEESARKQLKHLKKLPKDKIKEVEKNANFLF